MMTAEKWYEYQTSYKKYGFDMKPTTGKAKTEEKVTKALLSSKDKARLFLLTLFMGLLCITLIITAAYSAQVKYNINGLLAEADQVQGEIENLNVAIKSASNIASIEEKAVLQLGMTYPSLDQIAYVEAGEQDVENFAATLKQVAFNQQ